jgi:hypothetical protein
VFGADNEAKARREAYNLLNEVNRQQLSLYITMYSFLQMFIVFEAYTIDSFLYFFIKLQVCR